MPQEIFYESGEGALFQPENTLEPSLVPDVTGHQLRDILKRTKEATEQIQAAPHMSEEAFVTRTKELLEGQTNPHLLFGLRILAALTDEYPGKLVGPKSLNQQDGPQSVISLLHSYCQEHLEELIPYIDASQKPHEVWRESFQRFVTHDKHQLPEGEREAHQAHQRELQLAYMTQLAHIAFHIVYHGYTPVNHTQVTPLSQSSAISMSNYGSIITGSAGKTDVRCEYHRLSIRDQGKQNELHPQHLDIHQSFLPQLSLHPDQRTIGPIGGYGGHSLQGRAGFSPPIIIAVKNGEIPGSETTSLAMSQSLVSATISWQEVAEIKAALAREQA